MNQKDHSPIESKEMSREKKFTLLMRMLNDFGVTIETKGWHLVAYRLADNDEESAEIKKGSSLYFSKDAAQKDADNEMGVHVEKVLIDPTQGISFRIDDPDDCPPMLVTETMRLQDDHWSVQTNDQPDQRIHPSLN